MSVLKKEPNISKLFFYVNDRSSLSYFGEKYVS